MIFTKKRKPSGNNAKERCKAILVTERSKTRTAPVKPVTTQKTTTH